MVRRRERERKKEEKRRKIDVAKKEEWETEEHGDKEGKRTRRTRDVQQSLFRGFLLTPIFTTGISWVIFLQLSLAFLLEDRNPGATHCFSSPAGSRCFQFLDQAGLMGQGFVIPRGLE